MLFLLCCNDQSSKTCIEVVSKYLQNKIKQELTKQAMKPVERNSWKEKHSDFQNYVDSLF